MTLSSFCRRLFPQLVILASLVAAGVQAAQPVDAPLLPLDELPVGATGEVWTVFQGTEPEAFEVKVTGVVQNALGPGKSLILCELTDERVQHMGAVAGMSGSPLYVDGQLAGALSYQVQNFETVRHAGFTPISDLIEVLAVEEASSRRGSTANASVPGVASENALQPLQPAFAVGGLAPVVQELVAEHLANWGLNTAQLGGASGDSADPNTNPSRLVPGQAVAAALAVGDITLAATGTVSHVEDDQVLAFGHPFLGLGDVAFPMLDAEIVTILPSNYRSVKISNTGTVIGTVWQDRLSAIYGEFNAGPAMLPVTVHTPQDTLRFTSIQHPQLTPLITLIGLAQAVLGNNERGLRQGFALQTQVGFAEGESLVMDRLYAGTNGFSQGFGELLAHLSLWLQNPIAETFPQQVHFNVTPLDENPLTILDNVRLSRRSVAAGGELTVTVQVRDHQAESYSTTVTVPTSPEWVDRKLAVLVTNGPSLDLVTGGKRSYPVNQLRDFSAYLDLLRSARRNDGLYIAVVTTTEGFSDQTSLTVELPPSLARIARDADEARFQQRPMREVLWSTHVLPDRLVPGSSSQALLITP